MLRFWYHSSCFDGFGAAWAAYKQFGSEDVVYQPVAYGKGEVPEYEEGDDIRILDFSFKRPILEELHKKAATLIILDHHKTAEEDLRGLDYCVFDMERSGAGIAWDYFHCTPRPKLIDLLEDRDLWRFKFQETKRFHAYIRSFPFDFAVWDKIAKDLEDPKSFSDILIEGEAILRSADQTVEAICGNSWLGEIKGFEGEKVALVNTTCHWSEIGQHLLDKHKEAAFAASFTQLGRSKVMWSLRGRGDYDVSSVAKNFGGGGHFSASGFQSDTLDKVLK